MAATINTNNTPKLAPLPGIRGDTGGVRQEHGYRGGTLGIQVPLYLLSRRLLKRINLNNSHLYF